MLKEEPSPESAAKTGKQPSDPIHPLSYAQSLAATIPGAQYVELAPKQLDDGPHLEEVNVHLVKFLNSVLAPENADFGSGLILLVADLLHPVDDLSALELFVNRDMRHGRRWCGAMPMFFARRYPDHVSGTDLFDRAVPALYPAAAGRHDQGLAQRVGVPGRPGARLERDTGTVGARRSTCLKYRVDAHSASEIIARSLAGGL